jgi:hypothetical protein
MIKEAKMTEEKSEKAVTRKGAGEVRKGYTGEEVTTPPPEGGEEPSITPPPKKKNKV